VAQQNQPVGPDAEPAVAEVGNAGVVGCIERLGAVVNQNEVVAGAVVLVESHG